MSQTNISLENVIAALEACSFIDPPDCSKCYLDGPGFGFACRDRLMYDALATLKSLSAFKSYFDSLYGEGLEVANYHMNGDTEPFDNFYDSAMEEYENA